MHASIEATGHDSIEDDGRAQAPGAGDLNGSRSARPPGGASEEALERAFLRRPRLSIRARIVGVFLLLFAMMCGITVSAVLFLSHTRTRLLFLDKASSYLFEVEQARRFEKNYFLYQTNLDDAVNSAHEAEISLERSAEEFGAVLGDERLERMRANLQTYATRLERLAATPVAPGIAAEAEEGLRTAGARALADAEEVVDRERLNMHGMLGTSSATAIGFLVTMSLVMVFIVGFLTRSLLAPLNRFMAYTTRIGSGDYTPIQPARQYRDEFSNLALAVNHMLRELELRQQELQQAAKLAGVGSLTAGIAHELNNPLNNISLTTEALIDEYRSYSEAERLRMLDQIATQVERASATVRNLLDFTRRDRPILTTISIEDAITKALRLVENELAIGHIELSMDLPDELPRVRGNIRNLQQVFVNLFLNSIQAMPDGGRLEVRTVVPERGWIRVDIADTGTGIQPEDLPRVFEPFFTTKDPGEGTGLGLSVSFGIVQEHGGRLTVESEPGAGTTFSVHLPSEGSTGIPRGSEDNA